MVDNDRFNRLSKEVGNLSNRLEKFITNDFQHVKAKVNMIWWLAMVIFAGVIGKLVIEFFWG